MSLNYGTNSRKIMANDINQVVFANCTLMDSGSDLDGSYYIKMSPNSFGCGTGPNSKFYVEIKDNKPWTKISYVLYMVGTASCWNFNQNGSYGTGNLLNFDLSAGDRVFAGENSFELPQFTTKMFACDNDSTNFYHNAFIVGSYRKFYVTRRRNTSNNNLVNINVEWSCNSSGLSSYVILKDIFVW